MSEKEIKLPAEMEATLRIIGEVWTDIPDPELYIAELRGTEDELLADRRAAQPQESTDAQQDPA